MTTLKPGRDRDLWLSILTITSHFFINRLLKQRCDVRTLAVLLVHENSGSFFPKPSMAEYELEEAESPVIL